LWIVTDKSLKVLYDKVPALLTTQMGVVKGLMDTYRVQSLILKTALSKALDTVTTSSAGDGGVGGKTALALKA
jgi:hypothetical protein